jgi:cobalt-zinc-cadmium efflux system outer membrane protein
MLWGVKRTRLYLSICAAILLSPRILTAVPHNPSARAAADGSGCATHLSFEAFRGYALAHSPQVAEIDRGFALEMAKAFDTEVLANPELSAEQTYTRMYLGGDDSPQTNVALSQPLRLSNFGKRGRVADLIRNVGDVEKRGRLLEFSQKLLVEYTNLYVLQETERILTESITVAAQKTAVVTRGVSQGLLSQGSSALFEGEKFRLEAQRDGVSASIALLQSEIALLLGIQCRVVAERIVALPTIPSPESLIERAKVSALSVSSRNTLLRSLVREQLKLAELDAYPMISPRAVYQHTNDGGDFVGFGFSVPLPVFNRNQGDRMRTSAEERFVGARDQFFTEGGIDVQVTTVRSAASSLQRQVDTYRAKVVPAFEIALKGEERLFSHGQGSVLSVWQTFRALNEARLNHLALVLQAVSTRTQLSILVGEEV